jgi:hypothetical protein
MKKISVTILVAVSILLLAAAFRYAQMLVYSAGSGNACQSPDKRLWARASDHHELYFFGGQRNYYEFTIDAPPDRVLRRMIIDELPVNEMISWRGRGTIQWAHEGSSVTYGFGNDRLVLGAEQSIRAPTTR